MRGLFRDRVKLLAALKSLAMRYVIKLNYHIIAFYFGLDAKCNHANVIFLF